MVATEVTLRAHPGDAHCERHTQRERNRDKGAIQGRQRVTDSVRGAIAVSWSKSLVEQQTGLLGRGNGTYSG